MLHSASAAVLATAADMCIGYSNDRTAPAGTICNPQLMYVQLVSAALFAEAGC